MNSQIHQRETTEIEIKEMNNTPWLQREKKPDSRDFRVSAAIERRRWSSPLTQHKTLTAEIVL